ncbi:hypothetical protein G5C51_11940 [Streptomyces sp. A7024]|uniref:Thioesterase family protein n=1 Tax=Streptomyces coryli TaxID=1128680 RepID=A0A6G4TX76_9ACTN|nr:hypothetical protein [Streptomyces coryli]
MVEGEAGSVVIPAGVEGYHGVAFGGYVAGLLAVRAAGADEAAAGVGVDFRGIVKPGVPVPLRADGASAALTDDDGAVLVAAAPRPVQVEAPAAPGIEEARSASGRYLVERRGVIADYTECFGCGPDLPPERGIRVFPARVPGRELIAAAWTPHPSMGGEDGALPPELVWSALDCPAGWAVRVLGAADDMSVTAALDAAVLAPVRAGVEHVVYSWSIDGAGRKHRGGSAIATADGEVCVVSESLWIDPRQPV